MTAVTDRQIAIDLFSDQDGIHFHQKGEHNVLPSMHKVHEFFQKQTSFDTVKLCHEGKKSYVHFNLDNVETYDSKKALRKTLSKESGGTWIEEKAGKKRYFVDDSGWFNTAYRRVSKEMYLERLESPSTMQKVLGVGLGILALAPGVSELINRVPSRSKELVTSVVAFHQRSPILAALTLSSIPQEVVAQNLINSSEFQVNTFTPGSQRTPRIAELQNGNFVVGWVGENYLSTVVSTFFQLYDNSGNRIGNETLVKGLPFETIFGIENGDFVVVWKVNPHYWAQRFDSNGAAVEEEFQINTAPPQSTSFNYLDISKLNNGNSVATWISSENSTTTVSQIFAPNCSRIGNEFQVNDHASGNPTFPSATGLSNGNFVITWSSNHLGTYDVFAKIYSPNGTAIKSEFQVNTYTSPYQRRSRTASLGNGEFVIIWESDGADGNSYGISGQRFDQTGNFLGSDFQVNTNTLGAQLKPQVTDLANGKFVVIWDDTSPSTRGIKGQMFFQNQTRIGDELLFNTYRASSSSHPDIGGLSNGNFVAVWDNSNEDGQGLGIFGKIYNDQGVPQLAPPPAFLSWQSDPKIAKLQNGDLVVAFESFGPDGDAEGIFIQKYSQDGQKTSSEIQANTLTSGSQTNPAIGAIENGFVVSWLSNHDSSSTFNSFFFRIFDLNGTALEPEILVNNNIETFEWSSSVTRLLNGSFALNWPQDEMYRQIYNSSGLPQEVPFQVSNFTFSSPSDPSSISFDNGDYMLVWQEYDQTRSSREVTGQRFTADGSRVGVVHQINTHTENSQENPAVTKLQDEGYIVSWVSQGSRDGSGSGIFAQRHSATGSRIGQEFQVNTYTHGHQKNPCVAGLLDGGWIIIWESPGQDGSRKSIFARRYDSSGSQTGIEFKVHGFSELHQSNPNVVGLDDGGFFITWQSFGQDGDFFTVHGQRFDAIGNKVGPEGRIPNEDFAIKIPTTSLPISTSTPSSILTSTSLISSPSVFPQISSTSTKEFSSSSSPFDTTSINTKDTSSISSESSKTLLDTSSSTTQVSITDLTSNGNAQEGISLLEIEYSQAYSISLDGNTIGTFSFSGGDGYYNSDNTNFIEIEFAPGYTPQDGDTFTLFTLPEEEEVRWEDITLTGEGDCLIAEGELATPSQTGTEGRFQVTVSKSGTTCTVGASKFSAIPILTSGGLV